MRVFGTGIALASLVLANSAMAATFTVTLKSFGFGRTDCAADMADVAKEFERASGAVVLGSGCQAPDVGMSGAANGLITYAARERVSVYSSDEFHAYGMDGFYASASDCAAGLASEEEVFTAETGLESFVAYCYRSNSISMPRFRIRIDAVGDPTRKKHEATATVPMAPVNIAGFQAGVAQQLLIGSGARVVAMSVENDILGLKIGFAFYSDKALRLHTSAPLSYPDVASCRVVADRLQASWPASGAPVPSWFDCLASRSGDVEIVQINSSTNISSGEDFDTALLPTAYANQSACTSDMARVADQMNRSGTAYLAGACGLRARGDATWRMFVWSKRATESDEGSY